MKKSQNMFTSTRRGFLALGSATAGLAALGLQTGWAQNRATVDATELASTTVQTDVLIIGGGMAGLFAAVKAHDAGTRVTLVAKGRLVSSGLTPFAKGFSTFDEAAADMSIDDYVDTVSRSALGTNNPVYTRQTAKLSQARAAELRGGPTPGGGPPGTGSPGGPPPEGSNTPSGGAPGPMAGNSMSIEELRDHHMPMLRAADLREFRLAHETTNMIISAEMKLRASLMRTESRCSHYRLDYPDLDDENWRAWITIAKDENGAMQLEKQACDAWPDLS